MKRFLFLKIMFAFTLVVIAAQFVPASTEDVKQAVEATLQQVPVDDSTPVWEMVAGLVLVVLEVSFRLFPTTKDISILNAIFRLVNFLVPNRSTEQKYSHEKRKGVRKLFKIKAD